MSHLGEFNTHSRHGDHVIKQLNGRHPAGPAFVAAVTAAGEAGMRSHLDTLASAWVRLPNGLRIVAADPLTLRHRWIPGPTLLDAAQTDAVGFPAAVAEIGRWVQNLDAVDARVDTNLANFCLPGDGPVLVDVLPPLIPSLRPEPKSLFDELFCALCFDTPTILDALVGYALRALLCRAGASAARDLLPVGLGLTSDTTTSEGFPARWFRARRVLAEGAAVGDVGLDQVQDFFTATSVLGFRQLDETGRRLRIDHVDRRVQELTQR